MTAPPVSETPATRPPGRVSRALIRMFMKRASVAGCEPIAQGFRLITLESAHFRGMDWSPGQKLQICMGSAFVARTFTPIEWDATTGRTRILGYAHGNGPGSTWVRGVRRGDECDIFGPRTSLEVRSGNGPVAVFGDETSIGLVYAIARRRASDQVQGFLEVNAIAHARQALASLDLDRVELFERGQGDLHLASIERRMTELAASGATFILTGKASSIQRLRRALKALGIAASRLAIKPYWAPGKIGLD